MHTSIAVLALWGAIAPQINRLAVNFEQDYGQARLLAAREHKPICVFVGQGADGWKRLVREGELSGEVRSALLQKYVPVYINQETAAGQQLAAAFSLTGKTGLIISDRTGGLMAFRHEGELAAEDLARHLARYGDPNLVITTTVGAPVQQQQAPAYAPQQSFYPNYQNAFQNPFQQCRT